MYVTPDSLVRTYGLKLVEGRDFHPDEVPEINEDVDETFPKVVIVTRAAAQKSGQAKPALSANPCSMAPATTMTRCA